MDFDTFFTEAAGFAPYPWQQHLARDGLPEVLSIPTGLGKTEGVALGWAYRRVVLQAAGTPRHLVICLPMRVLVRQIHERLALAFSKLKPLGFGRVAVHALTGGTRRQEQALWLSHPEKLWVLIGTQDQLLSRALNRGYNASPYEWPMHFGILNNDCHWVLDEVQLMGPGVWTSAQLDWMRRLRFGTLQPCRTTWMSATVGTNFLDTRDRRDAGLLPPTPVELQEDDENHPYAGERLRALRPVTMFEAAKESPSEEQNGRRKKGNAKRSNTKGGVAAPSAAAVAAAVMKAHGEGTLSLVVCNTVRSAQAIFSMLPQEAPRVLLTSRFRPADRATHEEILQSFEAARKSSPNSVVEGSPGLICIATQVVEAGVDISARRLWSELAPWASMIQRLGRLNRDGRDNESACGTVFDAISETGAEEPVAKDRIGPYAASAIEMSKQLLFEFIPRSRLVPARTALAEMQRTGVGELFVEALQAPPAPLPRAVDVHGLFATERDVHGGFTDVSAYVRDTDPHADVQVFWRDFDGPLPSEVDGPPFDPGEACAVSIRSLRTLLADAPGYVWDEDAGQWLSRRAAALRPGMVVMLASSVGGYRTDLGWTGKRTDRLPNPPLPGPGGRAFSDDRRAVRDTGCVALSVHLADAKREAVALVTALGLDADPLGQAVVVAADEHDIGKAHPGWQGKLGKAGSDVTLWAKYPVRGAFRPGLRHEVASALAMMGRWLSDDADFPMLSIYLALAHHGKVRTHLRSRSLDGTDICGVPRDSEPLPLGVGQKLDFACGADGADGTFADAGFVMASPGWTGIVADLLGPCRPDEPWDTGSIPADEPRGLGPFRLAYLEALVRIADWRASDQPSEVAK